MKLREYIGRKFILQGTKYGALDGLTALITAVERVPESDGSKEALVATTSSTDFPVAFVSPEQLKREVKS